VPDPRIESYARLLIETCVDVQPGWQVLVTSSTLARPLVDEVSRQIARLGAYALLRLSFTGEGAVNLPWVREAPESLLGEMASIERHMLENMDAAIVIIAPENTREISSVTQERMALLQKAGRPIMERIVSGTVPWVGCQYPCPALAQEAEMSLDAFADFLYGAVLLDWEAEGRRMRKIADRFDAADEVRIVGEATDLTLSLTGRTGKVDAGGANMPGGEVFYSPVEDSAEGTITFSEFPAVYAGREVEGIRFRFEGGRIVEASAERNEAFLLETLDVDEGARRLGELGIGCNPGITRHMKNTLFDEKINGTVHLAIGNGFPFLGGTNVSSIHWDIVKDIRNGGELYLDGELVQRGGGWLFAD
jgi:aminopeptidase